MKIGHGKTRSIIESSIDSALLAVEIYNKPRTTFRKEAYITMMIIAWTKLFHAYFNHKMGDKFYFKKGNKYIRVKNNERKAWDLDKCMEEFDKNNEKPLSPAIKANLIFFSGLRDKVEHRYITKGEIENLLFGECQSCLYNYEKVLVNLFGLEYALNENLAFSLQFSSIRTSEQLKANKTILSKDYIDIKKYIEMYRSSLPKDVFDSQEYSIKLLQIPKISNTNRNDLAIEFVKWNELGLEDKKKYEKITALIKDKIIEVEAVNVGKFRPSNVVVEVKKQIKEFTMFDNIALTYIFSVKPSSLEDKDNFDTNPNYAHYDEVHGDYIYQAKWIELIVNLFKKHSFSKKQIKELYKSKTKLDITSYE